MTYPELLSQISTELPALKGQLDTPQVVYMKQEHKAYITFHSRTLVDEKLFLAMETLLRNAFPKLPLALRVVSPELGDDFLKNIQDYKQVLVDFLRRNYPSARPFVDRIDWRCQGHLITLTFPDSFSMEYMGRQNVQGRLRQAVTDIFALECQVELAVQGDQEKRLEEIRLEQQKALEHAYTRTEMKLLHAEALQSKGMEEKPAKKETAKNESAPEKGASEKSAAARDPAKKPRQKKDPLQPSMTDRTDGGPILGRSVSEHPMVIRDLTSESGLVTVQGDIFAMETKELRGGEILLVSFSVTDYTSSVLCKAFLRYRKDSGFRRSSEDQVPITEEERKAVQDKVDRIQVGVNVRLRGECSWDTFSRELTIRVRDMVPMEKIRREDRSEEKRIELHMHTNMSTLDGLSSAEDLIGRAVEWGHPAVAITDHGVLQSFPAAFRAAKGKIKLIPGCEGYLTDDRPVVENATDRSLDDAIVVLDFESTGLNTNVCRVMEIGAVRLRGGEIEDSLSLLVNPHMPIPRVVQDKTGITDQMVADKESAETAIPKLMKFIGSDPIAAHNAKFDASLLRAELRRLGLTFQGAVLDTLTLARKLYPDFRNHKLMTVCKQLGVQLKNAHRAVHDATATAECLAIMYKKVKEQGLTTLASLNTLEGNTIGDSWHIILLAATQEGQVNLNRLVSISHLDYFHRRPHMPRHLIEKYREGLILGSACEAGELYRAVFEGADWETVKQIASFYDYLEIQPVGNNAFMIRNGSVKDVQELQEINRKIVRLGEEIGKPVVATGDVHFLDPHNAINRSIIQSYLHFEDCDHQAPLYFKTTEEMLEEFSYLGEKKCHEVVIDNPRMIAERVQELRLFPKHPKNEDTFQPLWPDAADNIQNMTWNEARKMYGNPLPPLVMARIQKELRSIVGYGYCTLYNIAERLVSKSLEDGYLVGSRGSVGSSLVARLCGITEVNALPPHYRCSFCHRGFFDVDLKKYHVGVDLPDRDCPICGRPLTKDGFDIPFEVFLGFEGDKVPDIDLNFSGEYQNRAHHHVEELFGSDHVFRAGTIGTLAEKTALGYVAHYMEERKMTVNNAEKQRLALGCVGVKRTTGQHPGGMVVVPKEYEIYQFTAVQHPADDLGSDFTTTHFDFNSMHDILVKLDCLGHDDPTMMHMLEELTGINFKDVPLDDWGVRSLFHSPDALGISEQDILCNTGTFGVPEFGTEFVRGMLDDTTPSTMEELLRISGLSHGTDVWLGNAQDLIQSGTATLSECLCCRDDIMNYLIGMGVPPKVSFSTMESVRKGKGLKPDMVKAMEEHHVPEWFMDSCRKIQYMFPKGHAVAYVTMSLRVAWFKLHYPMAYYCSYFTVRGDGFDASTMLLEPDECRQKIRELKELEKPTAREKDSITVLEIVLEMYMRGIRFLPVDLYKSDVSRFQIEDGNLRCPFTSLSGLGESVAQPIVDARKNGPFISVEDLKERAHVGQSALDLLRNHGSLNGMDETSQLSMFSLL